MKKILFALLCLSLFFYGIAQNINLKTNGYNLNFTKIDTLFYSEYPLSRNFNPAAKKEDPNTVMLQYALGKISKGKADLKLGSPSFTTSYYAYEDGTLEAPTSQLFFKPVDIANFKKRYASIGIIENHPSLRQKI